MHACIILVKEGPIFRICEISLQTAGSKSQKAVCAPGNENQTEVYTNIRVLTSVRLNVEQSYRKLQDVPPYPKDGYLREFEVGVINVSYQIILRGTGRQ